MDGDHKMEHRWSLRKPVEIDVTLRRQGLSHKRYKTKNISLEGVFVDSGADSWPEDTFLELEFPVHGQQQGARHRIPVVVVHRSTEGMGLMFCVFDQQLFKTVEHLLYENPSGSYADRHMQWAGQRVNSL